MCGYFGPYRLSLADLVILATAEPPVAEAAEVAAIRSEIDSQRPGLPCIATTFRPQPIESVAGKRVFFATTAPAEVLSKLTAYLEKEYDCEVVGSSSNLSNRTLLRQDMAGAAGSYDILLTELKAAAIDVVATAGEEAGVPTVLCDNVPVPLDEGVDLSGLVLQAAQTAVERGRERG